MFRDLGKRESGWDESKAPYESDNQKDERKSAFPWIEVASVAPYFITEEGKDWHPVGQNDAISWVDLAGIFRRRNLPSVESYLQMLSQNGVTCLRLMLEYSQGRHRYLERPVGRFQPSMIRLWDDLFALCEKYGLRILLTPFDTFWMRVRWKHHPYNKKNGGICAKRSQWLICPDTRSAIKRRLAFATERWGGTGALFAWDIWNEIHPAHAGNSADAFADFIEDISSFLRETEKRLHGRTHPQTISVFGPVLEKDERIVDSAYRHPSLDFASIHFYGSKTIDNPKNTVDAAVSAGCLTRQALAEIKDSRPFFDSEHGPIHAFKDRHKTLPEPFDDEYFRHIQWAHLASGGTGGGMRWANRHPHQLTRGMRAAQKALARFLPLIDWQQFRRRNLNEEILLSDSNYKPFGCGDEKQSVVWILRTKKIGKDGRLLDDVDACSMDIKIPGLTPGTYKITFWNTEAGIAVNEQKVVHNGSKYLHLSVSGAKKDLALAIRFVNPKKCYHSPSGSSSIEINFPKKLILPCRCSPL